MNSCLVDVNVWLALSHKDHSHHEAAVEWFRNSAGRMYFCRSTQIGLLRLLSNKRVMALSVKTLLQAWAIYDEVLSNPRVDFLDEPANVEATFRELTRSEMVSHNTWSDSYLGAFALALDLSIVSFDTVFRDMTGVDAVVLTPRR